MSIMMKMENERRRHCKHRLVMVPGPFHGHMTPVLQLATVLHSKGFSITIAHSTLFNSPDPSNHPSDFEFLPLICDDLSQDHHHHHGLVSSISSHNIATITSNLNTNCVLPLEQLLLRYLKHNDDHEKIACIIYDGLMYFVDSVARKLNLPTLVLRTTSATNVLAYHSLPHLQSHASLPLQDDRRELVVPELEPLRFKDLPDLNNSIYSDSFMEQIHKTLGVTPSLGVIFNTVDCLEGQYLTQLKQRYHHIHNHQDVPIFPIGPFHIDITPKHSSSSFIKEDYRCITWLNQQAPRSVLYVSLGSIASWDHQGLTQMARGLANSKQRFLWVVRATTVDVSKWVPSLPEDVQKGIEERGFVVTWTPQREVLRHMAVGGFWSHCGWNSTLESLSEGVPMICEPCFGDQRVNARLVCHVWKVGVEWSNGNIGIEEAVRRLMVDEEGKRMWQRAQRLKDQIRQAVTKGGSSYNALNKLVNHILSLKY